jgi:hypothetical protein
VQKLQDMAAVLGEFFQEAHAVVRQRHVARHRHLAPTDQPDIREGVVGRETRGVVTNAVRSSMRPATRWMRVISMASVYAITGQVVVSRCTSLDVAAAEAEPEEVTVRTPAPLQLRH